MTNDIRERKQISEDAYQKAGGYLLLFYPVLLFSMIFFSPNPYQMIDLDYHFTLNAFMNHGTPALRQTDFDDPWIQEVLRKHSDPWYCLEKNDSGKVYGNHFWLWPLLCAPAALLFRALGMQPILAHPLTAGLLLWLVLFAAWKHIALDPARRFAFLLAAAITPALFYMYALGSEFFIYITILASLIPLSRRRYDLAAACVACASLQNTAIAPFSLFLCFFYLAAQRPRAKNFLLAFAAFSPALLSPVFYIYAFGRPSILAGYAPFSLTDASLRLLGMLLFDLNAGLVLFIPTIVFLYFAAWFRQIRRFFRDGFHAAFFSPDMVALLGTLIISLTVSVWVNWNSGYSGPARYAVYIAPLLVWISVSFTPRVALTSSITSAFVTACIIIATLTSLIPQLEQGYLSWGPFARTAMKFAPRLCVAWNDEIMLERTRHVPYGTWEIDGGSRRLAADFSLYPLIYCDAEWGPRKIMTNAQGWKDLRAAFDFEKPQMFDFIDRAFAQDKKTEEARYFNLPAFRNAGYVRLKELNEQDINYRITTDAPEIFPLGSTVSFELTIENNGEIAFMPALENMPDDGALTVMLGLAEMPPGGVYASGGQLRLILHATMPITAPIRPGETRTMPASITAPKEGKFLLVAMLGQTGNYFMAGENHIWLKQPITTP
ncbi:hypothetical protein LJC40_05190 [Synergistaceae bacterium OttesenSCG-928-D05]|nr:hypothetical protein [Synergistaceae bacterium OttesenSCG-928-D05]